MGFVANLAKSSDWKSVAIRAKRTIASNKEKAKAAARIVNTSMLTVAGGAAAGAIEAKMPYVPKTTVPTPVAIGGVLVLAGMTGLLEEQSDVATAFGSGMLAAMAARETNKLLLRQ